MLGCLSIFFFEVCISILWCQLQLSTETDTHFVPLFDPCKLSSRQKCPCPVFHAENRIFPVLSFFILESESCPFNRIRYLLLISLLCAVKYFRLIVYVDVIVSRRSLTLFYILSYKATDRSICWRMEWHDKIQQL
jgi:hypothetical protein